ncbi:MAG: hypothetical protein IPJ55_02845 [Chloracidobacterium sp.]|nr:hypothetical protein [Chloracidobacterium sp.]
MSKNSVNMRRLAACLVSAIIASAAFVVWYSTPSHAQFSSSKDEDSIMMAGTVSGTVYIDYNMNGTRDTTGTSPNLAVDSLVSNVTVTAYDSLGANRGSAVSGTNGIYSIVTTGTGPYRLEFTTLPSGYSPSSVGSNNASSVKFIADGPSTGNDFGIVRNSDYCQNNPIIATPQFLNGDNIAAGATIAALQYDATGSLMSLGDSDETGAVWGLAWRRKDKKLLASSVLKRHSGFGPGKDGVRGNLDDMRTIYVYDYTTPGPIGQATINNAQTIDLGSFGLNLGANPRIGSTPANDLGTVTQPNYDHAVFTNVGKRGIGGIALSEDENTLYAVNLSARELISLNLTNIGTVTLNSTTAIPNPGCAAGDYYAPWAVRVYQGVPYVGVVCTADVSQNYSNLRAYLLRLNGGTFTTVDLDSTTANTYISLGYDRTFGYAGANGGGASGRAEWRPWLNSFPTTITTAFNKTYATPIFSDMEFHSDGSISIGLMDRTGHQIGYGNYGTSGTTLYDYISAGDVLKVCNSAGNLIPEGSAGCAQSIPGIYDAPTNAGLTPPEVAGTPSEFYNDSSLLGGAGSDGHLETFHGGLASIPGVNELVMVQMNPMPIYHSAGFRWVSTTTGAAFRNYTLYQNPNSTGTDDTFGKSNGLGDIEALCDAAPLQIGNRIWRDANANGVQDPGEVNIAGVTVNLWGDTDANGSVDAIVGTSVTDANGNYIFGGINNTNLGTYACGTTPGSVDVRVNASSDDAEQAATGGAVLLNSNDLDFFGETNGAGTAYSSIGVRFNNLTIPQGATVTGAYIQFTANDSGSVSAGNPTYTIQGQNVDNASTFTTATNNISGRTWLSGNDVSWSPGAWSNAATTNTSTPSLTNIVQAIVNRGGWASGNSMAFRVTGSSTTTLYREGESWDGVSAAAPRLVLTYTMPNSCTRSVLPNTAYQVRLDDPTNYLPGNPLNSLTLTTPNQSSQLGDDDASDSDASTVNNPAGSPVGNFPVISLNTGGPGANNHTFDVGFYLAPSAAGLSVDGRVTTADGYGIRNVVLYLMLEDGTVMTARTGSFGYYRFEEVPAGQTAVLSIVAKRYTFRNPVRLVQLTDNVTDADWMSE